VFSDSFELIDFSVHGGGDGKLIALEQLTQAVPFEIKRIYYIYDVDAGLRRGFHAHKKLQQAIIAVSGSCVIDLDDGEQRTSIHLDRPDQGLIIKQPLWREMYNFSRGCVLMVVASQHYELEDYIRDYREFREFQKSGNQKG